VPCRDGPPEARGGECGLRWLGRRGDRDRTGPNPGIPEEPASAEALAPAGVSRIVPENLRRSTRADATSTLKPVDPLSATIATQTALVMEPPSTGAGGCAGSRVRASRSRWWSR